MSYLTMVEFSMFPEELVNFITDNRTELAQSFLRRHPLVFDKQYEDYQILRDVIGRGLVEMAGMLINEGFRVNLEPQRCSIRTPLHMAVFLGHLKLVELLLAKGAKVDACDERDQSPLHVAAKTNKYVLADLMLPLVSKGYQIDKDGLSHMHIACMRGNSRLVKKFLKYDNQLSQYEKLNLAVSKDPLQWPGFTPLHFAVYSQSTETARILLDSGADITIKDSSGSTPLHIAHSLQDDQMIDLILLFNKFVTQNPHNKENWSHFDIACTRDDPVIVAGFLQQRLSPETWNESQSPLEIAIAHQCTGVVQLILSYQIHKLYYCDKMMEVAIKNMSYRNLNTIFCKPNGETLTPALLKPISSFQLKCMNRIQHQLYLNSFERMIRNGEADVNETVPSDSSFWPGGTPLHFAARAGCGYIVNFLIQNGANINAKDARNKTPLHCAFENNQTHAIDSIISACSNTDFNPSDSNGLTHFHIFCARNKCAVVESFLQSNINVNHQVQNNSMFWPEYSSLHFAVYFNSKETVETLLKHGADANVRNGLGHTALEMSIMNLDMKRSVDEVKVTIEIIQLLLQTQRSKGDAVGPNKGFTLVQLACLSDQDDPSVLQEILDGGDVNKSIDMDVPRYRGYTALHFAVESGLPNKIKWLLDYGANPAIENASGNTPLHLLTSDLDCNIDRRLILPQNPISRLTGKSHFHVLCEYADFDTLEYALNEYRFDVNQKIDMNFTSREAFMTGLHLAVNQLNACSRKIQLLVDRGANVNARDFKQNTPLHFTGANKLKKDLEILLANGAEINALNLFGRTPMHQLCLSDLEDDKDEDYTFIYNFLSDDENSKFMTNKLKIMLANGADMNLVDRGGNTPLTLRIWSVSYYLVDHIVMNEHLLKLLELGFPINEHNDAQLQEQHDTLGHRHPDEKEFLALCRSEIEKMEKTESVRPSNLRSFLSEDIDLVAKHVGNIRFRNIVESDELKNEFPLYGYLVRLQFKKGEVRRDKLDKTVCHLNSIVGLELPRELSLKILRYLTNDDLDNLVVTAAIR